MYKKSVCWILGAAVCLATLQSISLAQVENLVQNPSFEVTDGVLPNIWGVEGWTTWNSTAGNGGAVDFDSDEFIDGSRSLKVEAKGAGNGDFQVIQVRLPLEPGKEYTASIWAKAEAPRSLDIQFKSLDNSTTWGTTPLELTTKWTEYAITAEAMSNNTVKLEVRCGASEIPMWLDFCNVYEGPYVEGILPDGLSTPVLARDPNPATESDDVPFKMDLSWTPGEFAQTHDVYFGSNWDDVNAASTDTPLGAVVSPGQSAASFDPGQLAFDHTYHWRVDEVNGAPDFDVHKGNIWSFTVEPKALPITAITVTASGANPMMAPENTINGSGLDSMDQHSILSTDMWLTVTDGSWIQYAFDRPYKLYELLVWNSNQAIEAFIGFGVKEMTVEYSVDGETWSALDGIINVSKASGQVTNTVNAIIDMDGIMAQHVKLSVVSAHGLTGQAGLSEVRFMSIPVLPRSPQPADGDTTANVDVQLSWRSGREAASHDVALSADRDAVINGTAQVTTVNEARLDAGVLDFGTTYTWQVVEVNDAADPAAHTSAVWSFTTPPYSSIDNVESYSGDQGEEVFMTWWDGFGGDDTLGGSTTGHIDSPFVETSIVNAGTGSRQSLPMFYDNNGGFVNIDAATSAPRYSEVLREFDGLDLTEGNAQVLALSFRGMPSNEGTDPLYLIVEDSSGKTVTVTHPDATAIQSSTWQDWLIPMSEFSSLRENNIKTITLGVGYKNGSQAGSEGVLYIDDLRLGTPIQ
jgi:hypothetical protein